MSNKKIIVIIIIVVLVLAVLIVGSRYYPKYQASTPPAGESPETVAPTPTHSPEPGITYGRNPSGESVTNPIDFSISLGERAAEAPAGVQYCGLQLLSRKEGRWVEYPVTDWQEWKGGDVTYNFSGSFPLGDVNMIQLLYAKKEGNEYLSFPSSTIIDVNRDNADEKLFTIL